MSGRIEEYDGDWETKDMLRAAAFWANTKRAIAGKKGQRFLRDLEAALLAMPEKRLVHGALEAKNGEVCALGAVCKARGIDMPKQHHYEDPDDYSADEKEADIRAAGNALGICFPLAHAVVWENDHPWNDSRAPEVRWKNMLDWCRSKIKETV